MTVLAGRLLAVGSTGQTAMTPSLARTFGVGVGGRVTYQLYHQDLRTGQNVPAGRVTFPVTAIVDIPPVLDRRSPMQREWHGSPASRYPRGCSRANEYGWVGVRLDRGAAGIPALQRANWPALRPWWSGRFCRGAHQDCPG